MRQLLDNRKQKNEILRSMLALIDEEACRLKNDEAEAFAAAAASFKALAAEVDLLERDAGDTLHETGLTDEERGRLGELDSEARGLLALMRETQEKCNQIVRERMQSYKSELRSMQKAYHRAQSYVNPYGGSGDGLYFDKKK
ncbi:MAG: flagellar export chaperone FlgN [Clostridiales bacterium]|jgi:flagellar biosynthesis/type III secretory pathway chaperone|nr:flagellar export chaperone FlgN [Clostridiales bacterium]